MLNWLIHSNAGLWVRIAIGSSIFAVLAVLDLRKNGATATRWKEYAVLLAAVVAALVYGAVNDQITSTISWEYFYYGKELDKVLGPQVPPASAALHWQAAKVGMKATWSAGLILGVILLLANNPRRGLPPLKNHELLYEMPWMLGIAAACAIFFGLLGYAGLLRHLSVDFQDMWQADIFRPRRFMCTWGIHLGGYVGGVLGTVVAAVDVMRKRIRR